MSVPVIKYQYWYSCYCINLISFLSLPSVPLPSFPPPFVLLSLIYYLFFLFSFTLNSFTSLFIFRSFPTLPSCHTSSPLHLSPFPHSYHAPSPSPPTWITCHVFRHSERYNPLICWIMLSLNHNELDPFPRSSIPFPPLQRTQNRHTTCSISLYWCPWNDTSLFLPIYLISVP